MGNGTIPETSATCLKMFHKATKLTFKEKTTIEVTFQDGKVKRYDMARLFPKYPQLAALKNRELFTAGKLAGYGIIWNDELDLETETVYEDGIDCKPVAPAENLEIAHAFAAARAAAAVSQQELAQKTGVNQADISKLENGTANPTVRVLSRLAAGLGTKLRISFVPED